MNHTPDQWQQFVKKGQQLTPAGASPFSPSTPGDATCAADITSYYDGAARIARALNISESTISRWGAKGRQVPISWALLFEYVSGGALRVDFASIRKRYGPFLPSEYKNARICGLSYFTPRS